MVRSANGDVLKSNSKLEDCCGKGHRASLLIRTGAGGRICLLCLSNLISDRNAFLIHRTYAVEQLALALTDNLFRVELLTRHPQFLVTPLSDAIGSSRDDSYSKVITEIILSLCENNDASLLQEFIQQIARQLRDPPPWTLTGCYTLHLIGLLLELHCKQDIWVPPSIINQHDFVPNLIFGLQFPGEELQREILYVLCKLASLQDGIDKLHWHSPRLCHVTVHALLKTESDELRINCIALLSILAESSVFDIRFGSASDRDGSSKESSEISEISFAKTFAEAMKGPLLSSDINVQASALKLICSMFPEGICLSHVLQIFVEEGIVDFVFEIIRLSEKQDSMKSLAVDVLMVLSKEERLFPHRFTFGLDTVIRVLEKSIDAPSGKLQTNTLYLLSRNLPELSGIMSTARAEHLLLLLTKVLRYHAKSVEDHSSVGDYNMIPTDAFNYACLTLISLAKLRCCASIPNIFGILQTVTASAVLSATSKANLNTDLDSLRYSACLLQVAHLLYQKTVLDGGSADNTPAKLVELCDLYLLPSFTDIVDNLDDEPLVTTFFETFTLFLKSEALNSTRFAGRLASKRCFTLSFELTARFPSQRFKETAYKFLSVFVDKLAGSNMEGYIEEALPHLAPDPIDLLFLLGQKSGVNQQLLLAHHAIIAIFSTSYSFNDRLAEEIDVVAALEQHLLANKGSVLADGLAPNAVLKQFVSLYASLKDDLKECDVAWSVQAERILELIIEDCDYRDHLLFSDTSKLVLRWFLQKESLQNVNMEQILTWFTAMEKKCSGDGPEAISSGSPWEGQTDDSCSKLLISFTELVGVENCGTAVLLHLFDKLVMQGVDDGIIIVTRTLTKLARMSVLVGHQLLRGGILCSVQQLNRIYDSKSSDTVITPCLELLYQLLYDSDNSSDVNHVMCDSSWLEVANQCATLVMAGTRSSCKVGTLTPLSLINLITQKSNENNYFTEACESLVCNTDMCARLEAPIIDASSQGAKLSQMDSITIEGELLCGASVFCLLRLRCALWFKLQGDNIAHGIQYIGFRPTASDCARERDVKRAPTTSISCEQWCRILYFGTPELKKIAACCIAEIFSQLCTSACNPNANDSMKVKELDMPINFFMSVTMVLQGSILGESEEVQRNSSCCLGWLLCSRAVNLQHKRAVANSPWNHMLVENLVSSLSNTKQDTGLQTSYYATYVAVGLLKMSPPPSYMCSLFSELSITNIISNLPDKDISPVIVCLFYELLLMRYLTNDHVRKLRDIFQETRRKSYNASSSLHSAERKDSTGVLSSRILNIEHTTRINHVAILELVIASRRKPAEHFSFEPYNWGTPQLDSCEFTCMLDTFLQESYLQYN